MKKIIILITAIFSALLNASAPFERGPAATNTHLWNFEFKNRLALEEHPQPVKISLTNARTNRYLIKNQQVSASLRALLSDFDLKSRLVLIIEYENNRDTMLFADLAPQCITKNKNEHCINKIFLTFECNNGFFDGARLRPQQGRIDIFSSFATKSESGVPLEYNIKQNAIRLQKVKKAQ